MYVGAAVSVALFAMIFMNTNAHAVTTVPTKMNFQGKATDSSGNVLPNGTYNMRLRIYDADTAGTLLWSSDRLVSAAEGVQVTNGLFSIQLGRLVPLDSTLFDGSNELFFEVELPTPATATSSSPVWTEGPLSPRGQLAASAFSYNSDLLDGLDSADFGQLSSDNAFTGSTNSFGGSTFDVTSSTSIGFDAPLLSLDTGSSSITLNGTAVTLAGSSYTNTAASSLFQNSSDSTAAFTIARAGSGGNLFVADTSNARIYIGDPTPDANTVFLVVDNSSAASDPTGTNGAMYYNTTSNSFRCYENGAWRDCITKGTYAQFYDSAGGTDMNNTTGLAIPWATETRKDTGYTHSNVTNPSRVYIDNPGWYKISYQINGTNGSGNRNTTYCRVRWNGTTFSTPSGSYAYTRNSTDASGTNASSVLVQTTAANEYYEVFCMRAGSAGTQPTNAGESWTTVETAD